MNWDIQIFQWIHSLAGSQRFDLPAVFFASYFQYILAGSSFLFILFAKEPHHKSFLHGRSGAKFRALIYVGLAFLSAMLARYILAAAVHLLWSRPRPYVAFDFIPLVYPDRFASFPSGHTIFFFAFSAVIFAYNKKWGSVFFLGSFLIALARVWAGVHYPSDILGGIILGILTGWLLFWLGRKIKLVK